MISQGASGNVAPKYFNSEINPPDACDERFIRSKTALNDMAYEVLKSVDKVIGNIKPCLIKNINMYSRKIDLFADVPSYERALEVAKDAKREAFIDGTSWLKEVKKLNDNGVKQQKEAVEIQYFNISNGVICGVPNEIMCEFAINASKKANNEFLYLGGYTNGCGGYFPTEEEYDKGGFEVYYSLLIYYIYQNRVFPLNRECASILINEVVKNIDDCYKKNN